MNIPEAIEQMGFVPTVDFLSIDRGEGPVIEWALGVTPPSSGEIDAFIAASLVPTHEQIDAERDRRITLGFVAPLTTGQNVPVDTRNEVDFRNINGLSSAAIVRMITANSATFPFMGADNETHILTPAAMIELGQRVLGHISAHYVFARALKAQDPIPTDFADEAYWS